MNFYFTLNNYILNQLIRIQDFKGILNYRLDKINSFHLNLNYLRINLGIDSLNPSDSINLNLKSLNYYILFPNFLNSNLIPIIIN